MTESEFNHLIEKYNRDLATDEERALLDAWFESIEHDDSEFTWNKKDAARQFQSIRNRIRESDNNGKTVPIYASRWLRIAATILILVSASYAVWYTTIRNQTVTVASLEGDTKKVLLSDGSLVWLKGKSTLQFPEQFDEKERTVYLTGEGLFEVAKDAEHPFVIRCGTLSARVLGTSFNLKASNTDIELTVLTGKVELSAVDNANRVVVLPNQKVKYVGLPLRSKLPVDETEKTRIITGTEYNMNFRNTSMAEILERIESKFSKKVQVDNPNLEKCLITADFTDQSLEDTLRMVAHILGFTYEIQDRTVVIIGGGCD